MFSFSFFFFVFFFRSSNRCKTTRKCLETRVGVHNATGNSTNRLSDRYGSQSPSAGRKTDLARRWTIQTNSNNFYHIFIAPNFSIKPILHCIFTTRASSTCFKIKKLNSFEFNFYRTLTSRALRQWILFFFLFFLHSLISFIQSETTPAHSPASNCPTWTYSGCPCWQLLNRADWKGRKRRGKSVGSSRLIW